MTKKITSAPNITVKGCFENWRKWTKHAVVVVFHFFHVDSSTSPRHVRWHHRPRWRSRRPTVNVQVWRNVQIIWTPQRTRHQGTLTIRWYSSRTAEAALAGGPKPVHNKETDDILFRCKCLTERTKSFFALVLLAVFWVIPVLENWTCINLPRSFLLERDQLRAHTQRCKSKRCNFWYVN